MKSPEFKWFNHRPMAFPGWNRGTAASLGLVTILHSTVLNAAAVVVAPEWKAHFRAQLSIENCVFEETSFSWGKTNLYHVRYQEAAFLVREISRPEEAAMDYVTGGSTYAARLGSNYWAIERGRSLKLFPNADETIRKFQNPEVSLIEAPRRKLIGALFFGFHLIDPGSVEWLSDIAFRASSFRNDKFLAEIREAEGGLPVLIEWHAEADPEFSFATECKYRKSLGLPYYPSEIVVRAKAKGKLIPVSHYRILSMEISKTPLPAALFDAATYFRPPASVHPQVAMVTNDMLFAKTADGRWERVVSGTLPDVFPEGERNPVLRRAIMLSAMALSVLPLLLVWRRARKRSSSICR